MKRLWIFVTVALIVLATVAVFGFKSLTPSTGSSAVLPTIVVPVDPTITALETDVVRQERDLSGQYQALQQTLEAQQADDEETINHLLSDIAVTQTKLQALQGQRQTLSAQITSVEATRTASQTTHRQALAAQRAEYEQRIQSLEAQLAQVQAQLAQLNGGASQ